MNVQSCRGYAVITAADPQEDMIRRQITFQRRLGRYDDRLSILHPEHSRFTHVPPQMIIHHLDMGLHEAHEAYDMLEGGWKHHKTNPKEPDLEEVLMELVDVMHFVINAYIFMGGQPTGRDVAAAVNVSREDRTPYMKIELSHVWSIGVGAWDKDAVALNNSYSHEDGAHGSDVTKQLATRVLRLIYAIQEVASTLRQFPLEEGSVPRAPGFIYKSIVPWICAAAAAIPGMTHQLFYSAFVHKNDINHARQDNNY